MPLIDEADVVVVGAGPAGWALAHACAGHGLDTVVVAPRPDAVWWPTYGMWADQAAGLPAGSEVVTATAVWAGERRLADGYAVVDNASVLAGFRRGGARTVRGSAVGVEDGTTVVLRGGGRVRGRVVVDASGRARVLCGGVPAGQRVEQTAYGVVVPDAGSLVAPGEAVFMRWGEVADWPTFLYAVPLPGGRTLLEETSLARRPGLPLDELARRLDRRLAAAGITDLDANNARDGAATVERVRFPVDLPMNRGRGGVVPFGVAAGMMHPATGYSVGEVLAVAPVVAAVVAEELPRGGARAVEAARRVVWSSAAVAVRQLRRGGLQVLLGLPPQRVPEFFDLFFGLPGELRRAYLTGRDDLRGTTAAMAALFRGAPWRLRHRLVTGLVR